jgi:hypothetical protein
MTPKGCFGLRHWIADPHSGKPEVVTVEAAADAYRNADGWHVSGPFVLEAQYAPQPDLRRIARSQEPH